MKSLTLFSGGGGVDLGLRTLGIQTAIAVEGEPNKEGHGITKLSEEISKIYQLNFPEAHLYKMSVNTFANRYLKTVNSNVDIIHASPVCSNFSAFSRINKTEEGHQEIEQAEAIITTVNYFRPQIFTLENVPDYFNSFSLKMIMSNLRAWGYHCKLGVFDCADYGIPQSRKRLFLIATQKEINFSFNKLKTSEKSWFSVCHDLLDKLPESSLLEKQKNIKMPSSPSDIPILIQRANITKTPKIRTRWQPFWTITKMIATDQKCASRTRFADIVLKNGKIKQFTIDCLRRVATFPDSYIQGDVGITGAIYGYAVPPKLIEIFYKQILSNY